MNKIDKLDKELEVTEGMSVGRGTPLVTISSHNIADGDPVPVSYTHLTVVLVYLQ